MECIMVANATLHTMELVKVYGTELGELKNRIEFSCYGIKSKGTNVKIAK